MPNLSLICQAIFEMLSLSKSVMIDDDATGERISNPFMPPSIDAGNTKK